MPSLIKQESQDNIGSLVDIIFIDVKDVENIPEALGINISSPVLLKEGKSWSKIEVTQETPGLEDKPNTSKGGIGRSINVQGFLAGHNDVLTSRLEKMKHKRFICIVIDFEGNKRLLGSLKNPMRFDWEFATGTKTNGRKGYELRFYQTAERSPYFYQSASEEIDEDGGFNPDEDSYLARLEERISELEAVQDDYLYKTLSNGKIFVGNDSGIAVERKLSLNDLGGTFGLSSSGVLTIPDAGEITRGFINTSSQTFAGAKTFTGTTTISTGTLTSGQKALSITATMPTTITATSNGIEFSVTSAGSSNQVNRAMLLNYASGYTGGNASVGLQVFTMTASTGNTITLGTGNTGISGNTSGTTSGLNMGIRGLASGGNRNIGVVGLSLGNKDNATNIGGIFLANNSGATPTQVGLYAGLNSSDPTFTNAALIADNGATTSPILVLRDNGSVCITLADGGNLYFANKSAGSNVTDNFQLYSSDFVSGNAAPHFKTENGDVLKLASNSGWTLPSGTAAKGGWATSTATTQQVAETVKALVDHFMTNLGFLKA